MLFLLLLLLLLITIVLLDQPQVPKVKVAEKISALQQLVSPFGKVNNYTRVIHSRT